MSALQFIQRKYHNLTHPVLGRILMLHRVVEHRSENLEQRDLEVTPQFLEQTVKEYQQRGYHFVSIDQACDIIAGKDKGKPFVCLTFDDGYQDNYDIAYPLLKRLHVPFTVYVTTGFIDNQLPMWWYPNQQLGMSAEELQQLDVDPLCTIGAHTVSHPKLDTLPYEEQYKEIADSKLELEQLLGHPIQHFSFPHGTHNADTLAICRELGFQTVAQSWGGAIRKGQRPYPLPRIEMTQP